MHSDFSVIERLDFSPEGIVDVASGNSTSVVKQHFVRQANMLELGIDKIYFSGEFPSVYFKSVVDFAPATLDNILRIQKKIWNQGKVAFLYVESPVEIRVYNCYEMPINPEQEDHDIRELELFGASKHVERDLEILEKVFGKVSIETGEFWKQEEFSKKVQYQRRVEQALMENLKKTRFALKSSGLNGKEGKAVIHDLLLRSLFVLYLEDRKATDADFYDKYKKGAKSYFDVLGDLDGTYRLFAQLEVSFNGNLSPVSKMEKNLVNAEHLHLIKECFWSHLKINGQQRLFDWRMFDFEAIPIELISAIYEEFLTEKEGEENQAKTGAYYTPRPLAEFILNKVLPYPSAADSRHTVKVLDPTCGSGIFLVVSLNRLLDRWEFSHGKPDFETIKRITLDNIFGIDIQREAVKVAAFSLYLAMLNRLDPKTIWPEKKFPYLICDPQNNDPEKQGHNLFIQSSIGSGEFENIEFDLVVGNPPFGRGSLDKDVSDYLAERDFPQEAVVAFLSRATELCPNGQVALVFAAKILFNKERTYENFRRFLFEGTHIEEVYNFAALRRLPKKEGGNFFASAVSPVGVLFYSKVIPTKQSNRLLYCSPKSAVKNRLIDGVAIDPTDVKYLPRAECRKPGTIIWKTAMWGTERDFHFIQRQLKGASIVEKWLEENGWLDNIGGGFQTSLPKDYTDYDIRNLPFLDAGKVERYYSIKENTTTIQDTEFFRLGNKIAYNKPHLLIKEGQSGKRFCASYIDFDCSFRKTVYGLHIPNGEEYLKILTAFFNSKLASYLLFLTTANWGVERELVNSNEILNLPDICFSIAQRYQTQIVGLVDQIIQLKKSQLVQSHEMDALEHQIDEAFYQALGYTENEQILIEDLIAYSLDAFQEKQKSAAYHSTNPDEGQKYAALLCNTLNEFLKLGSNTTCWATVFETSSRLPLSVVAVHFNTEQAAGTVKKGQVAAIHETLKAIDANTYQKHSESLYFRKFVRFFTSDRIYILKPNQKRFWSRAQALNDADEIIAEVLSMQQR